MHAPTFSINISARAALHALTLSIYVLERASASILSRGAFSSYLSIIMSNTNVYILKLFTRWIQVSYNFYIDYCIYWYIYEELVKWFVDALGKSAMCRIAITYLEPNLEYILCLTNLNGVRTHLSQHTIRIVCVNAKFVPMTP